ncbi:MAG TPA: DUF4097 family beta strand repeat-containing protein [Dokdonella sp.]|uniref:DUF4097 family beta strand repeat-containing protein n=1 Tax=Dokdonella sp. TaxID=2291710 RepID=UPI002D806E89|nr:DUF4097 family beta strand repeat-containing protein [Dokdonella sp.]HET9034447.1 DUF4097 family beta strand repeat-containing protein [Dokdonella sp.]
MKTMTLPLVSLLLLGAGSTALAGTPINQSRDVDASVRIEISNVRGSVTVSGWDQNRVEITGTLGSGSKGLRVEGNGSRLEIEVEKPGSSGWFNWGSSSKMDDSTLDIRAPRGAELHIDTVSAEVTVSEIAGRLLDVNSISGKIRLDSAARELEIGSISGSVELKGNGERVQVDTISGDIEFSANRDRLKFETVSGNITVSTETYREFSASSVSGDINLRGKPVGDARIDTETMSGDIRIEAVGELSARIEAETFSGRIRSDFGKVQEPDHGPGRSIDATVGDGKARLSIDTFSGDISIRRD